MFDEFLGLPPEIKEIDNKNKNIHLAVTKLTGYPEWSIFMAELDRLYEEVKNTPCEMYADNPSKAHYDSGMKRSLLIIKNFVENCNKYCQKYETEKQETNS